MLAIGTSPTDRRPDSDRQAAGSRRTRTGRSCTDTSARDALRRLLARAAAALVVAVLAAAPGHAQELAATQLRPAGSAVAAALPASTLSRAESEFVENRPVLRVAVPRQSFPPYQIVEGDTIGGYAIRFIQTVAASVGFELELRTYESWSDVLLALERREADVIPVAGITPERRRYLEFTSGVTPDPAGLVGRQDDERFARDPQLAGRRVGVIEGFNSEEHLPIQFPAAIPVPLRPEEDPVEQLIDGTIDFYYGPLHVVFSDDEMRASTLELKQRVFYGTGWTHIAVRSDWPIVRAMFDRLIGNGRRALDPLLPDLMGERLAAALPPLQLSPGELSLRASLTALRVGAVRGVPLFNDLDEDGRHVGIASELTSFVSYQIGLPVEVTLYDTVSDMLAGMRADEIDLIPYFAISDERERTLAFSEPYLEMPWVLMGRMGGTLYWDLDSFSGHTLAIRRRHPLLGHIREAHAEVELLLTDSADEAIEAVADGRAEATVETKLFVNREINERPAGTLRVLGELDEAVGQFAFATLKSDATLIAVVDKALADLPEALIDRIVRRWVAVDFEPAKELRRTIRLLVPALGAAALFLVALVYWNRRIRRENRRRRQAEQRLLDMTDRLQTGVFQFRHYRGKEIRLIFANRFTRHVGRVHRDERGCEQIDFLAYVSADEREAVRARLRHCLSSGEPFRETIRFDFPDGTKGWVLADANCREERDGARVWNGYLFDLTGERLLNEELNASLVARDEFMSMASHELRTPIQNVISALELIEPNAMADERAKRLDSARAAASDLELLVGDLIELSTLNHHEPTLRVERFDLGEQVREVCRTFEGIAREKGLAFEIEIDEGVPTHYEGDRLRCRQILYNIVGNAFKYTDRGSVRVAVRADRHARPPVLELAVSDTGIGIPEAQIARVFEPFATVGDASRGSSGLGLALCDRLAASMGGRIALASVEGEGSRFTLSLPLARRDGEELAPDRRDDDPGSAPSWNLDSTSILLVDDNLVVREMLAQLLERDGWHTRQAADGPAALELAARERFIAIVSDQQMPGMRGTELAERLREAHGADAPRPVLIMISGGMSRTDAADAAERFDAMLFKPIKATQIRHAIASVTGGEAVPTASSRTKAPPTRSSPSRHPVPALGPEGG